MTTAKQLESGERIGDYEVLAPLKSGGMAQVFLGRRTGAAGFSRPVVVKVIHSHLAQDQSFVRMFIDEAQLAARISHPNVARVEALGEREGTFYMVMEYVHGCSLAQLLRELAAEGRRLSPAVAVKIAVQAAAALQAAHDAVDDDGKPLNLVHRDVSPQNILLSYGGHVKLIDFGVAKARGRSQETSEGSLKGKIRYMSPEQAFGRAIDRRTDVYALGLVLWEMLTMRRAFPSDMADLAMLELVRRPSIPPPSELSPTVPIALDDVLGKALAPDPTNRFPTTYAFSERLLDALPEALRIDEPRLAKVVQDAMGELIDIQHDALPDSVSAVLRTDFASEVGTPTSVDLLLDEHEQTDASVSFRDVTSQPTANAAATRTGDWVPVQQAPPSRTKLWLVSGAIAGGLVIGGIAAVSRPTGSAPPSRTSAATVTSDERRVTDLGPTVTVDAGEAVLQAAPDEPEGLSAPDAGAPTPEPEPETRPSPRRRARREARRRSSPSTRTSSPTEARATPVAPVETPPAVSPRSPRPRRSRSQRSLVSDFDL